MRNSKCPKCGHNIFQVEIISPVGFDKDVYSLVCHYCSSIVGTVNSHKTAEMQEETNNKITLLYKNLEIINKNIGSLAKSIAEIKSKISVNINK